MESNQSKMDALNSQMNTLVESQAEEIMELKLKCEQMSVWPKRMEGLVEVIKGLKEKLKTMAECSDAGMLVNVDGDCIHNLKEENEKLKEERDNCFGVLGDEVFNRHGEPLNDVLSDVIEKLKQEVEYKKDAWDGKKVCEDLMENTNYTPETTFIEYIQKLEEEIETLKMEIRYLNSGYGVCGMGSGQTHVGGDFQED
jgi:hypothetical protein